MPILRIWAFCAALYSPKFYFPTTVDCCFPHTVDRSKLYSCTGEEDRRRFFFPPRNREKTRPCCVCGSAICPAHHQESLRGDLAPVRVYVYIYTPKIKPSVCEHAVTGQYRSVFKKKTKVFIFQKKIYFFSNFPPKKNFEMFSVTNEVGCVVYVQTQHICPCVCVCCLAVQLHIERNLYKESLCLQTRHVPLNFGDPLVLWGMVGRAAPAQSVTLSIPRRETVSCIIYYLESQIVWGGWMDGCLLVGLPNICLILYS